MQPLKVYYQMSTRNQSFLDMHSYLKAIGIKNNKFMLTLLDPDLAYVDPFDPNLNQFMKTKVLRECMANFWYFIREVVRIPDQGGSGGGIPMKLHRGNMAQFYCSIYNLNVFLELPRQHGKTVSSAVRYLYLFNFGTTNAVIAFMHKNHEGSKDNLQTLKNIRDCLPPYLRMNQQFQKDPTNKRSVRGSDSITKLEHSINNNKIITVASAQTKIKAQNLLRGKSIPLLWGDEWAFTQYNDIIYINTVPAYKTAAINSRNNGAPYGMLFSTTPGFLTNAEGLFAYQMKEDAIEFSERWYDLSYRQIMDIMESNNRSSFVHVRYTYHQLGSSEQWFRDICRDMQNKWEDIRREVLLEWSIGTTDSPFTAEELETVNRLTKEPSSTISVLDGKFTVNIYDKIRYGSAGRPVNPPIIGVDVSGGYKRDASAITIIDSETTKVIGDFKCNYISQIDLSKVIYEIVTRYMPNAVINVERNGGFGAAVIGYLKKTKLYDNLYYEYKERILEEQNEGPNAVKRTKKTIKVFGLDSTKDTRDLLIEILRERMDNHKDKFITRRLYDEFVGLEVKRNGKVEHSTNTHDDLTFSYLMAMYVWYEGKDLKQRYGITKSVLKTEEDVDESLFDVAHETVDITTDIIQLQNDLHTDDDEREAKKANYEITKKAIGILSQDWEKKMLQDEEKFLQHMLKEDPNFLKAYAHKYNMTLDDVNAIRDVQETTLPISAFTSFYSDSPVDGQDNSFIKAFKTMNDR